ncbi:MAG: HYR domain-containing protein, partial [Flavobacterium sp.]
MGNNYFTRKNIVITIVTFFTVLGVFSQATLVSNQSDYSPGSTAIFTGNGFQPGENVKVQVLHADELPNSGEDHGLWFVTADESGSFVTTWHVCEDDCLGSTLRAYAEGESSGFQAYTEFTDAAPWTITVSPSSSVCVGTATLFTFTVTGGGNGNGSIGCLKVTVPTAFGSLGTPTITSAPDGVATWSIGLSGGLITANTSNNNARIMTGEVLTFTIQATATTSTGSPFTWTTSGTENTNCSATITNPTPTSQPTVSVNPGPVVTATNLPASGNINNIVGTCGASVAFGANVTASGSPSPTITYSLSNFGATITSPQVFPVGITTVWVKASNTCGQDIKSFTVTVKDNQNPVITCPANIVKSNDAGICGAVATYTVGSSDNCPGQVVTQTAGLASGSVFPMGTTTNSFLVTDASGNTNNCSFTVKVNDTQNPVITCPSNIVKSNDAGVCGAVAIYTVGSSDNCTGQIVSQTAGLASGSTFPVGTTTNSFKVTDASGNIAT